MLKPIELTTIQAALQFWADEMCPHGADAMRPYLRTAARETLSAGEVQQLSSLFTPASVRYVRVARRRSALRLEGPILAYRLAARQAIDERFWATLILPMQVASRR